jgi:hypothetical protein
LLILLFYSTYTETGFISGIFGSMPRLSEKPGLFVMEKSKVFLVREWGDRILWKFRSGDSETGFLFSYLGKDAKILAETRFICIRTN